MYEICVDNSSNTKRYVTFSCYSHVNYSKRHILRSIFYKTTLYNLMSVIKATFQEYFSIGSLHLGTPQTKPLK